MKNKLGRSQNSGELVRSLVELGLYVAKHQEYFRALLPVVNPQTAAVIREILSKSIEAYIAPPIPAASAETSRELQPAGRVAWLGHMASEPTLTDRFAGHDLEPEMSTMQVKRE